MAVVKLMQSVLQFFNASDSDPQYPNFSPQIQMLNNEEMDNDKNNHQEDEFQELEEEIFFTGKSQSDHVK